MAPTKTTYTGKLSKADFEALAHFRYQLRKFLRFSEDVTQTNGITPLQYRLMLQGFPGRVWACVTEIAERLQSKHQGVVALVSRGESLGSVSRQASESDLRQVEVRLTPTTEQCVDRLARLHRHGLDSLHVLLSMSARAPRTARRG